MRLIWIFAAASCCVISVTHAASTPKTLTSSAVRAVPPIGASPGKSLPAMTELPPGDGVLSVIVIGPGALSVDGRYCKGPAGGKKTCGIPLQSDKDYGVSAQAQPGAVLGGWTGGCASPNTFCSTSWKESTVSKPGTISFNPPVLGAVFRPVSAAKKIELTILMPMTGFDREVEIVPKVAQDCSEDQVMRTCRAMIPSNWTIDLSVGHSVSFSIPGHVAPNIDANGVVHPSPSISAGIFVRADPTRLGPDCAANATPYRSCTLTMKSARTLTLVN